MFSQLIWCAGILLETLILFRAIRSRIFAQYPYFYTYFSCIFLVDLVRFFVYTQHPSAYRDVFWSTQFLSISVGYGVILEIVRQALAQYRGPARFGGRILWAAFFAVFGYIAFKSVSTKNWSPSSTGAALERDLRTVQALVLAAILIIIFRYGIELGTNLKGIIMGYGAFIGLSIINLAVLAYVGSPVEAVWRGLYSYVFFVPQTIWLVALWSYQPSPSTTPNPGLETDYDLLVVRTKGLLRATRENISGKLKE